jgi:hypothetical protein
MKKYNNTDTKPVVESHFQHGVSPAIEVSSSLGIWEAVNFCGRLPVMGERELTKMPYWFHWSGDITCLH